MWLGREVAGQIFAERFSHRSKVRPCGGCTEPHRISAFCTTWVSTICDELPREQYMFATGKAAIGRLQLLDEIFGPARREFLMTIGLRGGWRVADIGCGIGLATLWIAESNAAAMGLKNRSFHQASAYETGLRADSFDLAYSRFLMCHLKHPVTMHSKRWGICLRKGGCPEVCWKSSFESDGSPPKTCDRFWAISQTRRAVR